MSMQAEQNSAHNSQRSQRSPHTALQLNESLFRTLIENSSDIIALVTAEGIVSYVSPPVTRMMGYTSEDLVGQNFMRLIHPDDLPLIQQTFATILQSPGQSSTAEYRLLCKDDSWKWFEGTGVNLLHDPIAHAIVGNFRDITQRKQVEQERDGLLKQGRERLDELVENVPGVVWEAWGKPDEAHQRIDFVNRYVETMLGYSVEEWLQTPNFWLTIVHPEDRQHMIETSAAVFEGRKASSTRFRWLRKDGQAIWVESRSFVLTDEHGQPIGMRGVTMDVSAQVELERRKDDFMSMASHELKTPVTSIKGYTQLLIRKFEREGMHEPVAYLTRMDHQIDKLTRLIRDLLDVSKIQRGKLDYEETPIDIDALVRETIESVQQTTTTHILVLHSTSQATVLGDSERLSQVLINLLSNAIKYSPQADHVDVRLEASSHTVIISIQDYGVGIAKEHQDKLFERFYRVYENSNKLFPGLGIGLHISYEIVKRHHGEITLMSEVGKGSTFFVTLPFAPHIEV